MLKPPAPTISALNWNFVALWEMESCRCPQCSDQRPIQWSCPRRDQRGRALPALPSPSNQLSMPERTHDQCHCSPFQLHHENTKSIKVRVWRAEMVWEICGLDMTWCITLYYVIVEGKLRKLMVRSFYECCARFYWMPCWANDDFLDFEQNHGPLVVDELMNDHAYVDSTSA